jgi:hypothetical protein
MAGESGSALRANSFPFGARAQVKIRSSGEFYTGIKSSFPPACFTPIGRASQVHRTCLIALPTDPPPLLLFGRIPHIPIRPLQSVRCWFAWQIRYSGGNTKSTPTLDSYPHFPFPLDSLAVHLPATPPIPNSPSIWWVCSPSRGGGNLYSTTCLS